MLGSQLIEPIGRQRASRSVITACAAPPAAASRRLKIPFSAFRVSMEASRTCTSAEWPRYGEAGGVSAGIATLSGSTDPLAQRDTGLLGSASMIVTLAPCPASLVARTTAEVDFPGPPLELAKTVVGMPTNC